MKHTNTSGNQDEEIKEAEEFKTTIEDFAPSEIPDKTSTHISNLIDIITDLDNKIEEAKELLKNNDIEHNL